MKVRELEAALFDAFPREQAEAWDHVGLSVGDPEDEVRLVRVALDATAEEVRAAHAMGANVLVAHHPVYIEAPDAFTPLASDRPQAGAAVYEAARLGVSVLSFHTNLDRSLATREALPARLGLTALTSLEHADDPAAPGYGAIVDTDDLHPARPRRARRGCTRRRPARLGRARIPGGARRLHRRQPRSFR